MEVGGHNIDALPWAPKSFGADVAKGSKNGSRNIIGPPAPPTRNLEPIFKRSKVDDEPRRRLAEKLELPEGPRDTFLSRVRRDNRDAPPSDPAIMDRARLCDCDVYVERGNGDTATIVSLEPPPTMESVFGSTRLVERLAHTKTSARVLYAGFEEGHASVLTLSAAQRAKGVAPAKGSLLASSVRNAKALFRNAVARSSTVFSLKSPPGKSALVIATEGSGSRVRLGDLLAERPPWGKAIVKNDAAANGVLVEVLFPEKNAGLGAMTVHTRAVDGTPLSTPGLRKIATSTVGDASRRNATVEEIVQQLGQRLTRERSVQGVDFFLRHVDAIVRRDDEQSATEAPRIVRLE